jgi:hypothetical protein
MSTAQHVSATSCWSKRVGEKPEVAVCVEVERGSGWKFPDY